jgi:hypothetical protein
MNETELESEIQAKGLTAPRVTPQRIEEVIEDVQYFTAGDGAYGYQTREETVDVATYPSALDLLTFCVITLKNGFTVTGESACASPENFNEEIGRKIAYDNAKNKIWPLEGYLLKEQLYKESKND